MKRFLFTIAVLCVLSITGSAYATVLIQFKGRVIDARTGEALPGAMITIPDLRVSAVTDASGEFILKNIPGQGSFLVQVRYMGYETLARTVDFDEIQTTEFALKESVIEGREVVITGSASSSDKRQSGSIVTVGKNELQSHPSTNLIDALSRVPGVSQITTGNAISKPVIRGLSGNRVLTLSNGVKQQGQQWGDEHGIEVDQYSADRVEVLRGPASLMYGSDGLGGVINILDALPAPIGTVQGEFLSNYASNSGLIGSSLMLQGNENGFVYRVRGSYKNAHSYKTPDGYVPNSGFKEQNLSAQVGLNKSWGYAHLDFSGYQSRLGFYEPALNDEGQFVNEEGETFTRSQLKSRTLAYPQQDVRHYKLALNSNLIFGNGSLRSTLGYQHNLRKELEEEIGTPELFLDLHTYSYDFKYSFKPMNGWVPVLGVSGEFMHSINTTGLEELIPDYDAQSYAAFAYVKKNWGKHTMNGGLRFDHRNLDAKSLVHGDHEHFTAFTNTFSNLSGGMGYSFELNDQWGFKANAGSAFRAPNIAELSSNGVHEGAFRYEIGNTALKAEQSYEVDASVEYQTATVSASLGGYVNYIDNFIFYNHDGETIDNTPVYRSIQRNALLRGVEASLTLHPVEFFHFENSFSYTRATNRGTNQPLPFIPAATLRNEVRFEPSIPGTKKVYVAVGVDNVFSQHRTAAFELPTGAYTLLNAGIGTTIQLGKQELSLYVSGKNLLNKRYYDHLSRFKPGRLDESDPTFGIYNPGRNVTFGLTLPFTIK